MDVNREYGQITKVSNTRLKMRLEDLARVPPVGIIKGLLVWPDNCIVAARAPTRLSFLFCPWGEYFVPLMQWADSGSLVDNMYFCAARRLAADREKKNLDPLRWQLEFECMVLKWDTPLRQRRRLAGHQQTAQLSGIGACMSERAVLLMENLEEPENAALSLTDLCRVMLEEAGQTTDEGSLVCESSSDTHCPPGP